MTPTRPIMRYHGGKWLLATWIISHCPPHRSYVEPFGGAGSVLLQKPRAAQECWNDLNKEVVNVFKVLRDPATAAELENSIRLTPFSRAEFEESYLPCENPVEQARRTIVRSFMGFGSASTNRTHMTGFRAKSNRSGTTPAQDWQHWPDTVAMFTERLRGVVIECRPAIDVILQQDEPHTLFYVDPPYPLITRGCNSGVRQKYVHEMTDDDHVALAEVLHGVKGMVVLSGYPCDLYDVELFPKWKRFERKAFADGAAERTEVLWLNAAAVSALEKSRAQISLLDRVS